MESFYSQEEFFGDNNGLSITHLEGLKFDAKATGLSVYFKKEFAIGLDLQESEVGTIPTASVLFCPDWNYKSRFRHPRPMPDNQYLTEQLP